jgi:hypothetical protein
MISRGISASSHAILHTNIIAFCIQENFLVKTVMSKKIFADEFEI